MRIIQLIDSLEIGGSERMAINYANALANEIEFSGLVTSRKEGLLLNQIDKNVSYLFLNKKKVFDFKALFKLRDFVKKNKITIIHAHSSSFFLAFLLKLSYPKTKILWHDHYGNSDFLDKRKSVLLKFVTPFFKGIIAVNQSLKSWAEQNLNCKNVIYLPNFPSKENQYHYQTVLKGISGKRILHLANLREQKNHLLLLDVAKKLKKSHPEWSFHLVGKDFEDDYSNQIKNTITKFGLQKNVFIYGTKQDIENILNQSKIAILTSKSEGLPVSLLEYGFYKKPVVVTNVGAISSIIENGKNGFLIDPTNTDMFYNAIVTLIGSQELQTQFSTSLYETISQNYSAEVILKKYLSWLQNIE